jgi:peroxiredoxin
MPSYEADWSRFEGYNTHVLGISVDSVPSNKAWAQSLGGISYDLLCDFEPKGEVARMYGTYRPEGFSNRVIFVVDKEGRVAFKSSYELSQQPDNEELFEALRKLA